MSEIGGRHQMEKVGYYHPVGWDVKRKQIEVERANWRKEAHVRQVQLRKLRQLYVSRTCNTHQRKNKFKSNPRGQRRVGSPKRPKARRKEGVSRKSSKRSPKRKSRTKRSPMRKSRIPLQYRPNSPIRKTDERAPRYLAVERSPLLDFSHAYQKGRPLWIPEIMAVVDKKMLFGSEWGGSIPRLNRQNPIDFSLIPKHGPDAWLYMMRELAVNVKVIRARLVKVPNGYHQEAIEKWKDEKANEIQNIRGLLAQLLEAAKIQWEDVKLRLEGKERKYIGALTIIREKNKESLTRGDEKTIKMIFPSSDPIKPGKSDPKLAPGWDTWGTTAHQRNTQELEKREKEKVTDEKTDIPQDVPAKTDSIRWSHPSKEWIRVAHGPLRDPLFPHVRPTRLGNSPSRYKKKHARTKSSPPRPKTALGSSVRRSRNVKNSNINSGMLSTSGSIRAETRPTTAPSLLRVRSRSSGDI